MPAVAARDLVVIARDRRIRTKPQELQRFAEVGLRVFWIAGKKDLPTWGWLVRVVRHWDAIEGGPSTSGAPVRGSTRSTTAASGKSRSDLSAAPAVVPAVVPT